MAERERRVAENEFLFGAVNEQIAALTAALPVTNAGRFSIVCECGNDECTQRIASTRPTTAARRPTRRGSSCSRRT